jgi:hypothetical protein
MATPSVGRVQVSPSAADAGGETSRYILGVEVGVGGIGVAVAVGGIGVAVAVGGSAVAAGSAAVAVGGTGVATGSPLPQPAARARAITAVTIRHRCQVREQE